MFSVVFCLVYLVISFVISGNFFSYMLPDHATPVEKSKILYCTTFSGIYTSRSSNSLLTLKQFTVQKTGQLQGL